MYKHKINNRIPFLMVVGFWLFLFFFPATAQSQTLRIYHIDVEQGDATLFVSPSGKSLLVDSGRNGHGARIKAVMQSAGMSRIDFFVNTHYHEDHYGGIDELAKDPEITIGRTYDRGDKECCLGAKFNTPRFQDYYNSVGKHAVPLTRGETIPMDPAMTVTTISAGGVVLGEEPPVPGVHENDMSISLLIQIGGFKYFIGGDIEGTTEGKIAERDLVLDVDVYQANHHGSHTSSSIDFMNDLRPKAIIISNGNRANYMHPRQQTLDLFSHLDPLPAVFQTNKYFKGGQGGNVTDAFIGDLEASDADGTILITVDSAAGFFTVSYRDQSHRLEIGAPDTTSEAVVIESLLVNPVGPDTEFEEVSLRNKGASPVSMVGWTLRDESGRIWTLVSLGTIGPGQSVTIRRNGMPMSLNNSKDEITLLNASVESLDQFSYAGSKEGVLIETHH